jgi:hypothetical protein
MAGRHASRHKATRSGQYHDCKRGPGWNPQWCTSGPQGNYGRPHFQSLLLYLHPHSFNLAGSWPISTTRARVSASPWPSLRLKSPLSSFARGTYDDPQSRLCRNELYILRNHLVLRNSSGRPPCVALPAQGWTGTPPDRLRNSVSCPSLHLAGGVMSVTGRSQ